MNGYLGEIRLFAGSYAPPGWALCNGGAVSLDGHRDLFDVIGDTYGVSRNALFLPDLSGAVPIHHGSGSGLTPRVCGESGGSPTVTLTTAQLPGHAHALPASEAPATDRIPDGEHVLAESGDRIYADAGVSPVAMSQYSVSRQGGSGPHENRQPYLACSFIIAIDGPRADAGEDADIGNFLGEIRMIAGDVVPHGWELCDGRLLPIREHYQLYAIVGPSFGGDGVQTFALPDFRRRAPLQAGWTRYGQENFHVGESGGSSGVALGIDEMPQHVHPVTASSATAWSNDPAGKVLGAPYGGDPLYRDGWESAERLGELDSAGGGEEHENMQPYLAVNFIISSYGIYPLR